MGNMRVSNKKLTPKKSPLNEQQPGQVFSGKDQRMVSWAIEEAMRGNLSDVTHDALVRNMTPAMLADLKKKGKRAGLAVNVSMNKKNGEVTAITIGTGRAGGSPISSSSAMSGQRMMPSQSGLNVGGLIKDPRRNASQATPTPAVSSTPTPAPSQTPVPSATTTPPPATSSSGSPTATPTPNPAAPSPNPVPPTPTPAPQASSSPTETATPTETPTATPTASGDQGNGAQYDTINWDANMGPAPQWYLNAGPSNKLDFHYSDQQGGVHGTQRLLEGWMTYNGMSTNSTNVDILLPFAQSYALLYQFIKGEDSGSPSPYSGGEYENQAYSNQEMIYNFDAYMRLVTTGGQTQLDIDNVWSRILDPAFYHGENAASSADDIEADLQYYYVMSGVQGLAPWLGQDGTSYLQTRVQQAYEEWTVEYDRDPAGTGDFVTYMNKIGAQNWA